MTQILPGAGRGLTVDFEVDDRRHARPDPVGRLAHVLALQLGLGLLHEQRAVREDLDAPVAAR